MATRTSSAQSSSSTTARAKTNSVRMSREDLNRKPFEPATLAAMALAVTLPEWKDIGTDVAPGVDIETLQQRITALLAIRIVAILSPSGTFKDNATSTIGKSVLKNSGSRKNSKWPTALDETVLSQLSEFVGRMLSGYKEMPYHNKEHAYHVLISVNKLVDLMILSDKNTYGLRDDPLNLLAVIMAALIHDVEHQGIPKYVSDVMQISIDCIAFSLVLCLVSELANYNYFLILLFRFIPLLL